MRKRQVVRILSMRRVCLFTEIQTEQPVHENMSLHPTSFYAVGKLASEHYLRLYSKFGIKTTALRLFNVYGPGQNLKNLRQGMVSIYLAQAMKNRKVVVKGSGDRFRDLVYIDDVVDAFYKSLSIRKLDIIAII